MEPGEIGRHGAAAPKPVEKERRAGAGIAIPLQQLTEERSVQGRGRIRKTVLSVSRKGFRTLIKILLFSGRNQRQLGRVDPGALCLYDGCL